MSTNESNDMAVSGASLVAPEAEAAAKKATSSAAETQAVEAPAPAMAAVAMNPADAYAEKERVVVGTTADGYAITEDDTPVTVKESGGRRVFSSVPNNTTVTLGLKHDLQGFFGSVAFASFDDNATEEHCRDAVREATLAQGKSEKTAVEAEVGDAASNPSEVDTASVPQRELTVREMLAAKAKAAAQAREQAERSAAAASAREEAAAATSTAQVAETSAPVGASEPLSVATSYYFGESVPASVAADNADAADDAGEHDYEDTAADADDEEEYAAPPLEVFAAATQSPAATATAQDPVASAPAAAPAAPVPVPEDNTPSYNSAVSVYVPYPQDDAAEVAAYSSYDRDYDIYDDDENAPAEEDAPPLYAFGGAAPYEPSGAVVESSAAAVAADSYQRAKPKVKPQKTTLSLGLRRDLHGFFGNVSLEHKADESYDLMESTTRFEKSRLASREARAQAKAEAQKVAQAEARQKLLQSIQQGQDAREQDAVHNIVDHNPVNEVTRPDYSEDEVNDLTDIYSITLPDNWHDAEEWSPKNERGRGRRPLFRPMSDGFDKLPIEVRERSLKAAFEYICTRYAALKKAKSLEPLLARTPQKSVRGLIRMAAVDELRMRYPTSFVMVFFDELKVSPSTYQRYKEGTLRIFVERPKTKPRPVDRFDLPLNNEPVAPVTALLLRLISEFENKLTLRHLQIKLKRAGFYLSQDKIKQLIAINQDRLQRFSYFQSRTKRHEADSNDIAVLAERQQKRRSRAKSTKKAAAAAAED